MPSSLSPPFPAAREITPDISSCQIKKPSPPSPPPPYTPYGPIPSTRPSNLAESFCSWFTRFCFWFSPITTSTSPCYGKSSSTLASSSLAHERTSDFNYRCTEEGLCNIFRNRMDSKSPSVPPPPPLKPNIPVASRQNPHPDQYEFTFIMIWGNRMMSRNPLPFEEDQLQKDPMSSTEY